jgi:hypothetical protein
MSVAEMYGDRNIYGIHSVAGSPAPATKAGGLGRYFGRAGLEILGWPRIGQPVPWAAQAAASSPNLAMSKDTCIPRLIVTFQCFL